MSNRDSLLYQQIGERLKDQRLKLGLTQAQLAEKIGEMRRTSITNIEAGRQHPPLHVIYDLCQVLGLDIVNVLPTIAELEQVDYVAVTIDGKTKKYPPKSAKLLKELIDGGVDE